MEKRGRGTKKKKKKKIEMAEDLGDERERKLRDDYGEGIHMFIKKKEKKEIKTESCLRFIAKKSFFPVCYFPDKYVQ